MKIVIDLSYLKKVKLSVNEYLSLLKLAQEDKEIPFSITKSDYLSLSDKKLIELKGEKIVLLDEAKKIIEGKAETRQYSDLTENLRVIYPTGKKGGKWPWRGFSRDITDRLKDLDKNYGLAKYSDDQIVDAVKEYVSSFSIKDMDVGMQLLQYFIKKDGNSSLIAWLEDDSKKNIKTSVSDMLL